MSDCVLKPREIHMENETRNIGGPDVPPITKLQQGHLIYDTLQIPEDKRKFVSIPYGLLDGLINIFATLEQIFSQLSNNPKKSSSIYPPNIATAAVPTSASFSNNQQQQHDAIIPNNWFENMRIKFEDASEIVRIIKYYSSEPMVCVGEGEIYGKTTLKDHFEKIAKSGGQLQEIDKMTTTSGILESFTKNDYVK